MISNFFLLIIRNVYVNDCSYGISIFYIGLQCAVAIVLIVFTLMEIQDHPSHK